MTAQTIYDAAVFNDRPAVDAFLAHDAGCINERDPWGFTPLHGVAGEDHLDMLQYLISRGADVNAVNDEGVSPLHLAAYPEIAQALVRAGAAINAPDAAGNTPLHIAVEDEEGIDVAEMLIDLGADVNALNADGATPLDIAEARDNEDTIEMLQENGARSGDAA